MRRETRNEFINYCAIFTIGCIVVGLASSILCAVSSLLPGSLNMVMLIFAFITGVCMVITVISLALIVGTEIAYRASILIKGQERCNKHGIKYKI